MSARSGWTEGDAHSPDVEDEEKAMRKTLTIALAALLVAAVTVAQQAPVVLIWRWGG